MKKYALYIPNLQEHSSVLRALLVDCESQNKPVRLSDAQNRLNMTVKKTRAILERLIGSGDAIAVKVGRNYQYFRSEEHRLKATKVEVKSAKTKGLSGSSSKASKTETSSSDVPKASKGKAVPSFVFAPSKSKDIIFEANAEVIYPVGYKRVYRALADPRYEVVGPVRGEFSDDWIKKTSGPEVNCEKTNNG